MSTLIRNDPAIPEIQLYPHPYSHRYPHRLEGAHQLLSESEARVLRYLPTHLSAPEIAQELYLSVNTVKTHMKHVYDKLGVHRRREAVDRARAVGLLDPNSLRLS